MPGKGRGVQRRPPDEQPIDRAPPAAARARNVDAATVDDRDPAPRRLGSESPSARWTRPSVASAEAAGPPPIAQAGS